MTSELQPQQILDAQADMPDQIGFTPAYAPDAEQAPNSVISPAVGPGMTVAKTESGPLSVVEAATGLVTAANGTVEKSDTDNGSQGEVSQTVTDAPGSAEPREKTVRVVGGAEVEAKDKTPKEKNRTRKFLAGIALGLALLGSQHSAEPVAKAPQPAIEKIDEAPSLGSNDKPESPLDKGAVDTKTLPDDIDRKVQLAQPEAGMLDNPKSDIERVLDYGLPTSRDLKPGSQS